MAKPPPKPGALSTHAKHCKQLGVSSCAYSVALARVGKHLKAYWNLSLPSVGPAPSCESIVAELRARDKRADFIKAEARKRRGSRSMDSFVIYAWPHVTDETRARLLAEGENGPQHGDLHARWFARTIKDQFDSPQDYASFIDELMRLS